MSSIEFIKHQLTSLVISFPEIRARYDNDEVNNSHVIEIVPNETYHNKNEFRKIEEEIIFNFIDLYPFENIIFLSGDDDYKIEKVDFEISGAKYNSLPTTTACKQDSFFTSQNQLLIWDLLVDFQPNYQSTKTNLIEFICPPQALLLGDFDPAHDIKIKGELVDTINSNNQDPVYSNAGLNNYALAA